MKRTKVFLWCVVTSVVWGMNVATHAGDGNDDSSHTFTNRSIKGTWGYSGGLAVVVPPAVAQNTLLVAMGTVKFDGQGGCEVNATGNFNGVLVGPAKSDTCVYTVNPDGTGTSVATFSEPGAPMRSEVSFVIVDQRREIRFINTDTIVGSFIAKRQ